MESDLTPLSSPSEPVETAAAAPLGLASSQAIVALQSASIAQQSAALKQQSIGLTQQQMWIESLQHQLQQATAQVALLEAERSAMLRSSSWKLTRPLRWVGNLLKNTALRGVFGKLRRVLNQSLPPARATSTVARTLYDDWLLWEQANRPVERTRMLADVAVFAARGITKPQIAVVMPSYNPPLDLLDAAIESVRRQSWNLWTLHIADDASTKPGVRMALEDWARRDPRIHVSFSEVNGHISKASNLALSTVTAPYFALLDQDDLLADDALLHVAVQIMQRPDVGVIYSDEDKIDTQGKRSAPYFKPDFNPDLLLGQNTVSHLGVYSTAVVHDVGGFRESFEGAQDHDLVLRCVERLRPDQIVHIPRVLYHWRVHAGSTAANIDAKPYALVAGVAAVQDHMDRTEPGAKVSLIEDLPHYRVRFPVPEPLPIVTAIVPTRDGLSVLKPCIDGLLHGTDYAALQVLIVDNGSNDPETLAQLEAWAQDSRVRVRRDDRPFNYSALNNAAVAETDSEFVLLLNSDISMIHRDWLLEMVGQGLRPGVGAVGAALWYPDDTLQHGGVILGVGGVASHAHKGILPGQPGYFGRARLLQAVTAVTAACLLVRRSLYQTVGGFNESDLSVAYNDVDFCIRLAKAGYRNIWTPFAQLYHHESVSRGNDQGHDKVERFQSEVDYMRATWQDDLRYDPAYNPNLTLQTTDFAIATPPRHWPRAVKTPLANPMNVGRADAIVATEH